MAAIYPFFLFAAIACLLLWALAGVGVAVDNVFGDVCVAMSKHLSGEDSTWMDAKLPCKELAQDQGTLDAAMEAANGAVLSANEAIAGAPVVAAPALACATWLAHRALLLGNCAGTLRSHRAVA
jgi:hypothetical protein